MTKANQEKWTRAPSFKKYYGSVFGLSKSGKLYRLDVGNEKVKFSENEIANVAECQIIFDEDSFEALIGLFKNLKEVDKKKSGKRED